MLQIKNTLGGGKPNAPYAWAKYEVIPDEILTNPSIDLSYVQSSGRINITGANFDLSFLPSVTNSNGLSLNGTDDEKQVVDFFTGFQIATNQYKLYLSKDVLTFYFEAGALTITEFHNDTDGTWFTVAVIGTHSSFEKTLTFTGEKIGRRSYHNFIEYITDKSPTKYPNGEVNTDGYFYRYASEGLYVWKKYEAVTIPAAHITFENSAWSRDTTNDYMYKAMNSTDVDVSILKKEDFDGATGTTRYGPPDTVSISNGIITYTNSNTTKKCEFKVENGIFYQKGSDTYNHAHYGALTLDIVEHTRMGDFIDYIVSDKETAYPDGGEKGGYWYERVGGGLTPEVFGCTKVAIDAVTFASDQAFMSGGVKYYLPHSLGEIPKHAILWAQTDITTYVYPGYLQGFDIRKNVGLNAYVCVNWLIENNNSFIGETRAASLTADNVFINGGVFKAGVEYKLITMV